MQISQHWPANRIGLLQSAGGHITWSHCAMADCSRKESTRRKRRVSGAKLFRRVAGFSQAIIASSKMCSVVQLRSCLEALL